MKFAYLALYLAAGFGGFFLPDLVSEKGSCESPRLNTTALAAALGSGAWPASPAEATVTPADTAPLTPAPVAVEASEPAKPEPAEFNASSSGFLQRVPEEEVRLDKLPRPFYCDPLEHVIVINLQDERGKPKRDSLAQELEKAGINSYNFFPAVDHEIDEQLKSEMSAQDPQLCDTLPKCKSTLGRALSHRQVHEKIIAEQWSCAMILEDHAKLAENFTSRLREVARDSFPGFDVIQLGRCEAKGTGKDAPPKDQSTVPTLFQGWPGRCANAYVASIYGAVSMAQANTPISLGRDVLLSGNHKYENRFRAHVDHKKPAGSYWYTDPALSWPSE